MTLEEATSKVSSMAGTHSGKLNGSVNFQFDEGVIHLDDSVSPAVISNDATDAQCTIKMTLNNFEKMMEGNLNPMMAFMSGKMKIEGDKGVAMKLAGLF